MAIKWQRQWKKKKPSSLVSSSSWIRVKPMHGRKQGYQEEKTAGQESKRGSKMWMYKTSSSTNNARP